MNSSQHAALQDLAEQLRSLRAAHFLTQQELADLSGVARITITRIESARTVARAGTIRALADALGANPEDLVGDPSAYWP